MTAWVFGLLGGAIVVLVIYDVFVTIFSTGGAGPLTSFGSRNIWRGLLAVHRRKPIHRLLATSGPLMLVAGILVWHLTLAVGWILILAGQGDAVVQSQSKAPVDPRGLVYFVGTTISTVGYGDLVPSAWPWTLVSNAAALLGTVVLTTSLSYVLAVLAAGIERKALAEEIFAMGRTVPEFVDHLWHGGSRSVAESYALNLAGKLNLHAHQHMSYPILRFFHSVERSKCAPRALLLAADAFFLMGYAYPPDRALPENLRRALETSLDRYADLTASGLAVVVPMEHDAPPHLQSGSAGANGGSAVDEASYRRALEAYLPRRNRLVGLCRESGWDENVAVAPR